MGLRGPKPVRRTTLLFFAEMYYGDFKALARGLRGDAIDKELYENEIRKLNKLKLSYGDRLRIKEAVEKEVDAGHLPSANQRETIEDVQTIGILEKHSPMRERAARDAKRSITQPAQPAILRALLAATEPEQVHAICRTAFKRVRREIGPGVFDYVTIADWPIEDGSQFPFYLSKHADQFLSAKLEKRFPRKSRPSNLEKQLWFLACALAGAVQGLSTCTAVKRCGSRSRKRVIVPAPYSLWERGESGFSKDLRRKIEQLKEQIAEQISGDPEFYAGIVASVHAASEY
jgi:hypothetical protein